MNIIALREGSRLPEVVEWYYQYQSELVRKNSFLEKEQAINIHFAVQGRNGMETSSPFKINVRLVEFPFSFMANTVLF